MSGKDKNTNETVNARPDGMVMQIVTSLLCIAIGGLLIAMPNVNVLYMCYCFCAALIVIGITLIVSYFVAEAYRRLNDYRFAVGVLLIILGCIELLRANILAEEIMFIIGLVTLVLAVIIMQSTVQMRILKSGAWVVQLIFTIVSLVGAILVLVDFAPVMTRVKGFAYIVMVLVGTLCLISLLIEAVVLWSVGRKEAKTDSASEVPEDKDGDCDKDSEEDTVKKNDADDSSSESEASDDE